jgi:hypothetical protein
MPGTAVRGASHDPGTDWTEPLSYPCKADLGRAEASAAVAYGAVIAPGPLALPRGRERGAARLAKRTAPPGRQS